MEWISSRIGCKGMDQKSAGGGISWNDMLESALEVPLGLLLGPLRTSGGQHLETEIAGCENVATVTARVSRAVLQENGLDRGFENLEAECRRFSGRWTCRGLWWLSRTF